MCPTPGDMTWVPGKQDTWLPTRCCSALAHLVNLDTSEPITHTSACATVCLSNDRYAGPWCDDTGVTEVGAQKGEDNTEVLRETQESLLVSQKH